MAFGKGKNDKAATVEAPVAPDSAGRFTPQSVIDAHNAKVKELAPSLRAGRDAAQAFHNSSIGGGFSGDINAPKEVTKEKKPSWAEKRKAEKEAKAKGAVKE